MWLDFLTKNSEFILGIIRIVITVLFAYSLVFLVKFLINYLYKKAINTSYIADVAVLLALKKPIILTIWFYCGFIAVNILNSYFNFDSSNTLFFVKIIVLSLNLFWFLFNFINQYTKRIIFKKEKQKETIDYGVIDFIRKIVLIFIGIVLIIITMNCLGIRIKGLAALGGIGGLAIGWASQDLLGNLFGGFSIILDKPFTVGDWIASPDKDIEGIVEQIGWRQTKIMRFTNFPIYLPNKIFSEMSIENKGRMKARAINELLRIRFCDLGRVQKITDEIKSMLLSHKDINSNCCLVVALETVSSASLDIRMYTFTYATSYMEYMPIKQEILLKAMNIIRENGAELEYETTARFIDISEADSGITKQLIQDKI